MAAENPGSLDLRTPSVHPPLHRVAHEALATLDRLDLGLLCSLLLPLTRSVTPPHLKRIAWKPATHAIGVAPTACLRLPRSGKLEIPERQIDPPAQILPLPRASGMAVVVRLAADRLLGAALHCCDDPTVVAAAAVHMRLLEEAARVLQPTFPPLRVICHRLDARVTSSDGRGKGERGSAEKEKEKEREEGWPAASRTCEEGQKPLLLGPPCGGGSEASCISIHPSVQLKWLDWSPLYSQNSKPRLCA